MGYMGMGLYIHFILKPIFWCCLNKVGYDYVLVLDTKEYTRYFSNFSVLFRNTAFQKMLNVMQHTQRNESQSV